MTWNRSLASLLSSLPRTKDRTMHNKMSTTAPIAIRRSAPGDGDRIRLLARLDDRRIPAGPCLVAEIEDEMVAALSLVTGAAVSDPFRPTADALALLHLRAAQLGVVPALAGRPRRRLLRPAPAA